MLVGIGTILTYSRGHDDELNTLAAGTTTGLLFKSTGGFICYALNTVLKYIRGCVGFILDSR